MKAFIKYINEIWKELRRTEMKILPGNISFFFVLSLIPTFILLIPFASFFGLTIDQVVNFVNDVFPKEAADITIDIISGKGLNAGTGTFNIIAFFVASNGTYAIVMASNLLYNVTDYDEIKARIKSVVLLLIIILLVIFLLLVPVFGNQILTFIRQNTPIENITDKILFLFELIKWPLTLFILYFNIKLLYVMAPSSKVASRYTTDGAILTTVLWTLVTALFSYYINEIANYNAIYGSLSSIIVLMVWIYVLSYIFVLGIAINSTKYKNAINRDNKKRIHN